jgi:hypothetical protein
MTVRGGIPTDLSNLVGNTTSAECKPIRIAESLAMDSWTDHYIAQCRFWLYEMYLEKWRRVPARVLGGYCRGTREFQSTWRVLLRSWELVMFE